MFCGAWGLGGLRMALQRSLGHMRNSRGSTTRTFASASSASASTAGSSSLHPVIKAGLISGSLSLTGDLVAQLLLNWDKDAASYDASRAMRMGTFGLFLYGPYQHFWYSALDRALPARTLVNFAGKVTLNQLCLAPLVIGGVFAWNLGLQGQLEDWVDKVKQDFVPTLFTGWKFWVPAASVNFVWVPLQHQVLYMSACGVVWTAFLSYSSTTGTQQQPQLPAKKR